jgi:hypothetical protein
MAVQITHKIVPGVPTLFRAEAVGMISEKATYA